MTSDEDNISQSAKKIRLDKQFDKHAEIEMNGHNSRVLDSGRFSSNSARRVA